MCCLVLVCLSAAFALPAEELTMYAQIMSLKSQFPGQSTSQVSLEKVDGIHGVRNDGNALVISQDGTYFIMAAGQVGLEMGVETFGGMVDMWLVRNGKPIANSGVRQTISNPQATAVLISQSVMPLKAGDIITVGYSSNKASHGLVAIDAKGTEPAIPSIIFSLFRIGL